MATDFGLVTVLCDLKVPLAAKQDDNALNRRKPNEVFKSFHNNFQIHTEPLWFYSFNVFRVFKNYFFLDARVCLKSGSSCSAQMVKRSLQISERRGSSAIIILSFVVPRIFIFELEAAKLRLFFIPHTEQIYKLQVLLRLQELNLEPIGFEAALLTTRQPPRPIAICRCQWRLVLLRLCNKEAENIPSKKPIDVIFAQQ